MWRDIYDAIRRSGRPLSKHEIKDLLTNQYGRNTTPASVSQTIANEWKKGNCSIYADVVGMNRHYVYNIEEDYYDQYARGVKGV